MPSLVVLKDSDEPLSESNAAKWGKKHVEVFQKKAPDIVNIVIVKFQHSPLGQKFMSSNLTGKNLQNGKIYKSGSIR